MGKEALWIDTREGEAIKQAKARGGVQSKKRKRSKRYGKAQRLRMKGNDKATSRKENKERNVDSTAR